MRNGPVDILTRAAALLAEADGLRTGTGLVAEQIARSLSAKIAFMALKRGDSSVADIVAAHGLGAVDFRRLESRIAKSSLWRMLSVSSPFVIDSMAEDAVLGFLAFGTGARMLIAVPVAVGGATHGLLAVGFPSGARVNEEDVIKLLNVVSLMITQMMRVERIRNEESQRIAEENAHLKQELKEKYDFSHLIGNSSPMRAVYDQVTQIARTNDTVLLRGESGTGKELIAGAIHYNSLRSKRPFVKINCAAFPGSLIDNELFGYESGTLARRKSQFEQADGGTLFLDEVGDLPLQTQARLLSVLERREFERPGGGRPVEVNVRLIAAATRDLETEIAEGRFRQELFFRLNGFTIFLPPLRERKSDIMLLAEYFLERSEREHGKRVRRISTPAIDMLTAYHFPGNVRELENVIDRAVLACDSSVIHGHHLPPTLQTAEVSGTETRVTLVSAVEAFESDLIQDTLKSTRGNVARAAKMLDSTERILGYKIKKYGVNPRRFRK